MRSSVRARWRCRNSRAATGRSRVLVAKQVIRMSSASVIRSGPRVGAFLADDQSHACRPVPQDVVGQSGDPCLVADPAVGFEGGRPGEGVDRQHGPVDLLGDRHVDRVGQLPSALREPVHGRVGAAARVGADQRAASSPEPGRELGEGPGGRRSCMWSAAIDEREQRVMPERSLPRRPGNLLLAGECATISIPSMSTITSPPTCGAREPANCQIRSRTSARSVADRLQGARGPS